VPAVIDSDGHVMEPLDLWARHLPAAFAGRAPVYDGMIMVLDGVDVVRRDRYVGRTRSAATQFTDPKYTDASERGYDAASQLDAMDVEGIEASVLYPSIGLQVIGADGVDPALITAMAAAYNDALAEFCGTAPTRLFGAAMLDVRDPDAAAAEATRCVEDLGFVAAFFRPNVVGGRQWYDPAYDKLLATIAELGVPLALHEGSAVALPQAGVDHFETHALWHAASHPIEAELAITAFVLGGVLERHPMLRVGFLEAGAGWLPYWMWRMDEAFELDGSRDTPYLTMRPSDYVRRQCFVSIDSDEEPGIAALEALDGTHVVWGSDYPHPDAKFPHAREQLAAIPGMTADWLANVTGANALELYGPALRDRLR
jgi:predicted TIM-barrel fold metal-dependent hydrolase